MDDALFASLLAALAEAATRVEASVRAVPPGAWDEVIHSGDGPWSRRKLLAHMASNDLRQNVRVRIGASIAQPGAAAAYEEGSEVDAWNAARVAERAGHTVEELLAEMRANRASLIALLGGLTVDQRGCRMPFRGRTLPLEEMLPFVIGHIDQHAAELSAR